MAGPNSDYSDVTEMFRQLKTFDEGSSAYQRQRDLICERCLPLADHIARRYRNRGEAHEDLVQAARVGLVNALNRFDVDNGAEFLSFAVPTMMGEVRRHFRDHAWAVKVPRTVKDLQMRVNKATAKLAQGLGRAPTATEIAEHLGVDREQVVQAAIAGANYSTLSTDIPAMRDDDSTSIGDSFGGDDTGFDKVLDVETVRPLIAALPSRERDVLTLRFFEDMTQSQIAAQIGCSQMHVSRLLAKALETLRSQVKASFLAAAG
ncbi:SigB/SigF/SigG family RNA polymerase sigma factor [Mycolicibacterium novocastrense]|uniref:SigB/SigF/SigG family RNA polymerase sigma factor n=2 Tax=Mycolicibacterium novocastrense TaxID=59813 RepID=A0AAW5SMB8_MYCNV|nr:SigB/SigF/SigG family RNA polymerase sigma factor [Mycolicibacterium novocastrense]MCV7024680.1 SigB/SigF/SigG family RNA polymerase sigma factor [Mycolicibacterium novocastrense]